jgi:hypothetical protein
VRQAIRNKTAFERTIVINPRDIALAEAIKQVFLGLNNVEKCTGLTVPVSTIMLLVE